MDLKSQTRKAQTLLAKKQVVLFDLDGTLYLGAKVLPGAVELVSRLQEQGKRVFFFTNNSSRSETDYVKKLKSMGFQVSKNDIVMSTHSLISGLKKRRIRKVFLLGTPSMRIMLRRNGILCLASPKTAKAVVVGFDKTLTYKKLLLASQAIAKGLPYFVTHPDYFCPTEFGPEPDCGSFALVLEKTTKKKPQEIFGKPNPAMIKEVQKRARCKKSEMIMLGDRLMTDIEMARKSKIDSIFVLSGDNNFADIGKLKVKPSAVVRSVKNLL